MRALLLEALAAACRFAALPAPPLSDCIFRFSVSGSPGSQIGTSASAQVWLQGVAQKSDHSSQLTLVLAVKQMHEPKTTLANGEGRLKYSV